MVKDSLENMMASESDKTVFIDMDGLADLLNQLGDGYLIQVPIELEAVPVSVKMAEFSDSDQVRNGLEELDSAGKKDTDLAGFDGTGKKNTALVNVDGKEGLNGQIKR